MKKIPAFIVVPVFLVISVVSTGQPQSTSVHILRPLQFEQVSIQDPFWSKRYQLWTTTTVYDVFDKFEGHYKADRQDLINLDRTAGSTMNAFRNFDAVASGKSNTGQHDGPPWYDGLVYESICGAADLLSKYPDAALEARIDGYIDRIVAAQDADPQGFINTYTTLTRPSMRFGTNGGNDNWQHDVYNSGMLVEAAVHYYKATGKTKLLDAAVKLSNYMFDFMGPSPKQNVVPGHGGPEEALIKLYWLFEAEPGLNKKLKSPVHAQHYYQLATYWIEQRGDHGETTGNTRPNFGAYDQDSISVFEQPTIEGHAVRATLLATGVATAAIENRESRYASTASRFWENMVGQKMFITGGEGAIHEDEKFGPDYYLPENAYLETCASIGSGFFSQRMNELMGAGKYIDALERSLYNNILSGISLDGHQYFYENPLKANDHKRWNWHGCPCCPPMILKMFGELPRYIYATDESALYVNLFIGTDAKAVLNGKELHIIQETDYPWKGKLTVSIVQDKPVNGTIKLRIPGWARNAENPAGLYQSDLSGKVKLLLNGKEVPLQIENGYTAIEKEWIKGDRIELDLPVGPRIIKASDKVENLANKFAIAAGPIIYGLEETDNPSLSDLKFSPHSNLTMQYRSSVLDGINTIEGVATTKDGKKTSFTAVPFFSIGNREPGAKYQVWLPEQ